MRVLLTLLLFLLSGSVFAEKIVYQKDKFGNDLKHKPAYVIKKDGSVVSVDFTGKETPHKPVQLCVECENKTRKK